VRTPDLEDLGTGSVNVVIFRDDDGGYLAWVAANSRGFVMNIRRSLNPSDARVHRARCWTIAGDPTHGKIWTGPYIKLCATELSDLDSWASDRLDAHIARCRTCLPTAA
jgi:hypothetical protein